MAVHWPAQVLTLIWERGGEEFISNTKLTPFNPVVRYLKEPFDAGKHASPVQMIPTTKSHKFSSFLPILSLLQILGACCHHLGRVKWKERILKLVGLAAIRKMSQLVIWRRKSCTRGAKVASKLLGCTPLDHFDHPPPECNMYVSSHPLLVSCQLIMYLTSKLTPTN